MKSRIQVATLVACLAWGATAALAQDDRPFDVQVQDACSTDPAQCVALVDLIPPGPQRFSLGRLAARTAMIGSNFTDAQKTDFFRQIQALGNVEQLAVIADPQIRNAAFTASPQLQAAVLGFGAGAEAGRARDARAERDRNIALSNTATSGSPT